MNNFLEEQLETTSCPLCSSNSSQGKYTFGSFKVVKCRSCDLWYLSPRLLEKEMLKLYSDTDYFSGGDEGGYSDYAQQESALKRTFRKFVLYLAEKGLTGGDLLEVGCGYGYLLMEAKDQFKSVAGTEYSPEAVAYAKKKCECVITGGVYDIPEGMKYDCIIAVGVLEHVYEPVSFVKELAGHLRDNGVLVFATPNFGSFWRRLFGSRWPSFKVPEHVVFYDQETLNKLFETSGFKDMQVVPYPHAFPISLVAEKLGFSVPSFIGKYNIWLPATTVAIAGRKVR